MHIKCGQFKNIFSDARRRRSHSLVAFRFGHRCRHATHIEKKHIVVWTLSYRSAFVLVMPDTLTTFPYVVVRVDCTLCARRGRYRLARLADKYGANCTLNELLELLAGDCKYRGRPRHPIRPGCGARFKDLEGPNRPRPDTPLANLRVVAKGASNGKRDVLRGPAVRPR